MKNLFALFLLCACVSCSVDEPAETTRFTDFVDPYIGTGGHGHVFVGANVPFGMVQLGPTNITEGWDWVSGYHISDSTIVGFSHLHMSGTGIGDLQDIMMMPVTGNVEPVRGSLDDPDSGVYSIFRRETETVRPGYYSVRLDRYGIDAEMTAANRVGMHRYTFPASDAAAVIINLGDSFNWDEPTDAYLVQESDTVISGYRHSTGWADSQRIYFTARFSKPLKGFELFLDGKPVAEKELKAAKIAAKALFDTGDGEQIIVKVALSPVSIDNAKMNMEVEMPGWDFDAVAAAADAAWNGELGKVRIETPDENTKTIFYTALYHTMIAPSSFHDVNGDYRGADGMVYNDKTFRNYTTFSLWDTYRAAHPLMTIIHPEKMDDMVNTMLNIYRQQGKVPVWHLMGCETDCMVGNPAIPVMADAILKGFGGFDKEAVYEAMKTSAMLDERGLKELKEYGYIPYDLENEALAKCMEYAIADWALAQAAKKLGKKEDYKYFAERSKSYKRYFDPATRFVRGLSSKGTFRPNFNPFLSTHGMGDYTEGNAWQYTWLVPHDIEGLVELFGSVEDFIFKLDMLFVVEGDMGRMASPDISGLIGQYAHGNEPSHHVAYIYPFVGQTWKTAARVREIMSSMYTTQPDGLSGNEDVGQMSAWYVLSALGFYQVEPAGGRYVFGSPLIDKAVLQVGSGRELVVTALNNSPENIYIQGVRFNGKPLNDFYIRFEDIKKGGTLEFKMGSAPSMTWGITEETIRL